MEGNKSELEEIFDAVCNVCELTTCMDDQTLTAQGSVYSLGLEKQKEWTRLTYRDRVATADFYDCLDQSYLVYSILAVYEKGQESFLQAQDSEIAKKLLEDSAYKQIQPHRHVIRISLDDFSEVDEFLSDHIMNY